MSTRNHRSQRLTPPLPLDTYPSHTENQGGPIGLDEAAPLSGTQLPEALMDTHEATGALREAAGNVEKNYGRAKDKVTTAAEDLAEQSGINREQVSGAVREYAGKAEKAYGSIKAKLSQAASDFTDNYETTRDTASRTWDNTVEYVQENPGTAIAAGILIGAGIGALVAYLNRD